MRAHLNGADLFYTTHGRGLPMLVMHGGLGWDHTYLRPGLDALGEEVELIYFDHRGNGRSARPADWEGISHGTWVEDADALREHLGHQKILLFGHSYGGYLAQEYALAHPERLDGLILCCTGPVLDYSDVILDNARARGTPAQVESVLEAFSGPVRDDEAMQRITSTILPLYFHGPDSTRGTSAFEQVQYSAEAFNHAFLGCVATFNTLDQLRRLAVPTLVLAGAHDWIMPPAQGAKRIHAALPMSELVVFQQSGHFPWIEQAGEFLAVVEDWVNRVH